MKVTSKMSMGIIDRMNYISLTFDDNTEIRIGEILEYDLDFDNINYSTIYFKTAFIYDRVLKEFRNKEIKNVCISFLEIDTNDIERMEKLVLDIKCSMKIRKCRISGEFNNNTEMYIELEGMVL